LRHISGGAGLQGDIGLFDREPVEVDLSFGDVSRICVSAAWSSANSTTARGASLAT
jgi:hypothetical protein